ncbi:MAG: RNA polymerase sigma factor [Candidatus Paceibacterota bacterium]
METNQQKFEKAYREYALGILRHVYFRVNNWDVAQDLTQETFFKAWRNIAEGKIEEIKNFKAFFYKIANNTIIDYYRSKKEISLDGMEEVETMAIIEAEQENEVDLEIEKKRLERYLFDLKDEYKQILIMRYIDDLSIKEISQITDKTRGNVRILIYRALQVLKKKYGR